MIPAGPPPAITQRVCSFSAMRFQSNTAQIRMKANMSENAQDRAAFTYNAAADFFDASPLGFWDYFGRRTIELASLPVVRESSMFVVGLELPLCQLRKQSDRRGTS